MAIGALLAIPRAKGLFRRAILQSGAAAHVINRKTAELIAHRLADMLSVRPTAEEIANVPISALLAAQGTLALMPSPRRTRNGMATSPSISWPSSRLSTVTSCRPHQPTL
jgi:para-nitrobenzyl esterase